MAKSNLLTTARAYNTCMCLWLCSQSDLTAELPIRVRWFCPKAENFLDLRCPKEGNKSESSMTLTAVFIINMHHFGRGPATLWIRRRWMPVDFASYVISTIFVSYDTTM